jgi:hypothetical protein
MVSVLVKNFAVLQVYPQQLPQLLQELLSPLAHQ